MAVELDLAFHKTEGFLSKMAIIPAVGTPFGAVKIMIGAGQFITALALGILTLPMQCTDDASFNDHCWNHVKHGLGNISAGILESIPFVAIALHYLRETAKSDGYKFMPYESLKNCSQYPEIDPLADEQDAAIEKKTDPYSHKCISVIITEDDRLNALQYEPIITI